MKQLLWVGFVMVAVFGKWVNGYLEFNETELSYIEDYQALNAHGYGDIGNSSFGDSKAYSPLMVPLTLIKSAAAKGAGNAMHSLLLTSSSLMIAI